jgi:hypothetical protein
MTSMPTRFAVHQPKGWRGRLALHPETVDFSVRGFRTGRPETREVLERSATAFLDGYNRCLDTPYGSAVELGSLPAELRGFAAEGAGMSATLLDRLSPNRHGRLATQLAAHGDRHLYLLYVGAGWALAKLGEVSGGVLGRPGTLGEGDPLLRWLAYDGYGFFKSFFASERGLGRWRRHRKPCDRTCAIRYQGLGRSLWFRECGDPEGLAERVATMPAAHRGDVWSGVGLAATYANGVSPDDLTLLGRLSGRHRPALAQGSAFAAEARRADTCLASADTAVRVLAGVDAETAAAWTWQARRGLNRPGAGPADFGEWRARIQESAARHLPSDHTR